MPRAEVDVHSHREFAAVTALLVAVVIALYVHLFVLAGGADAFLQTYGAVPYKILSLLHWRHPYRSLSALQAVLTSLLLHASWVYLFANVLFLLLFGASVEERLGHYRFLLLFAVSGALAVLAQSLMVPDSRLALVGAEGGVAGVAGACLTVSPRGQVATLVRGVAFPWLAGPVLWLVVQILLAATPLPMSPGVEVVGLPYLLLAYAAGAVLGPVYLRLRPVLLRG